MPDFDPALLAVRGELDAVEGRLAELDAQRERLVGERAELAAAVRAIERCAERDRRSASAGPPSGAAPVAERVLASVEGQGFATRAILLSEFRPSGITEDAVDSAIRRLIDRGALRRDGRRLLPVAGASPVAPDDLAARARAAGESEPAASSDVPPDAAGSDRASAEAGKRPVTAVPRRDSGGADADGRPRTEKILKYMEASASGGCFRSDLLRHFCAGGFTAAQFRSALHSLTRDGRLVRSGDSGDWLVLSGRESRSDPSGES